MRLWSNKFLQYYEAAHQNPMNRYIHHVAHSVAVVGAVMLAFRPLFGVTLILIAFCLSWIGHYAFERNTPAFFETNELQSRRAALVHHLQVAVGGVVWTFACGLRVLGLGPMVR